MEPGEYRLVVEDNGDTTIVGVREGGAEIERDQQVYSLHASQEGRYTIGTSSPLLEEVRSVGPRDELEAWADSRESATMRVLLRRAMSRARSSAMRIWTNTVNGNAILSMGRCGIRGAFPRGGLRIASGSGPISGRGDGPGSISRRGASRLSTTVAGHTFAIAGAGCRAPRHVRPVYSPALVGWVPRGHGYAWFPLGPREVYIPRHRASDRYVRQVNVTNTNIVNVNHITNVYRNREAPGRYMNEGAADHVKALPRQQFVAPRIPARYVARATPGETRAARPATRLPALQPSRDRDGLANGSRETPRRLRRRRHNGTCARRPRNDTAR